MFFFRFQPGCFGTLRKSATTGLLEGLKPINGMEFPTKAWIRIRTQAWIRIRTQAWICIRTEAWICIRCLEEVPKNIVPKWFDGAMAGQPTPRERIPLKARLLKPLITSTKKYLRNLHDLGFVFYPRIPVTRIIFSIPVSLPIYIFYGLAARKLQLMIDLYKLVRSFFSNISWLHLKKLMEDSSPETIMIKNYTPED